MCKTQRKRAAQSRERQRLGVSRGASPAYLHTDRIASSYTSFSYFTRCTHATQGAALRVLASPRPLRAAFKAQEQHEKNAKQII